VDKGSQDFENKMVPFESIEHYWIYKDVLYMKFKIYQYDGIKGLFINLIECQTAQVVLKKKLLILMEYLGFYHA
jgi:hypothetical protein